jgi:hypothetical protein
VFAGRAAAAPALRASSNPAARAARSTAPRRPGTGWWEMETLFDKAWVM